MKMIDINKKIKWLVEDLKSYEPEKIILFGSALQEGFDQYSDIDVAIIKNTKKRFLKRLVEAARLIRSKLYPIDIFVYTPEEVKRMQEEESPFWEQVSKKGIVIYEKP